MSIPAGMPFDTKRDFAFGRRDGDAGTGGLDEEETAFTMQMPERPYPGLRPFEKNEWPIFFGRERMADSVVAQLVAKRVLVVHGDSGCGKSSLIRAAVLPRLEQDNARGGVRWCTAAAMPREAPLWNLARALARLGGVAPDDGRVVEIRRVLNFGREAPAALANLIRRSKSDHVCLLIDQFEELFDHARHHGPDEAQLLIEFLISLFKRPPDGLYAVLTMRSEYLGACARFQGFAETVNATQYLLPRMEHDDLVRAIREPAMLYGGDIDSQLTERLIADVSGNQDQLPLIQHGLMLMYGEHVLVGADTANRQAGEPVLPPEGPWQLGLKQFETSGGLSAQLSDHATKVMREAIEALNDKRANARVVEDMFRALTDINAEGHAIRRPRTLAQLERVTGVGQEVLCGIVEKFRADGASFLKPYGVEPIAHDDLIDISHEALIRSWSELADPKEGWLIREFRNGLVWRSLLVQADGFERDASNLLGPTTTSERSQWLKRRNAHWAERYGGGWGRVIKLVEASQRDRDRKATDQAGAERLKRRLHILSLGGIVAAVSAAALGAGLYFVSKSAAEARLQERYARDAKLISECAFFEAVRSLEALRKVVGELQSAASSATPQAAVQQSLDTAQEALAIQTSNLGKLGAAVAPRVYIHISDESQRAAAAAFEIALEARDIDQTKLVVPGIQLVKTGLQRSVLRCFRAEECRIEGPRLAGMINQLLERPQLVLEDLSATYGNSPNIRDRHYEIWFAPGNLVLKSRAAGNSILRKD